MTDRPPASDPPDAAVPAAAGRARIGGGRWLLRFAVLVFFIAGIAVVALRELVLPRIDEHRDWIAERLSQAVGVEVRIGRLSAELPGPALRVQASAIEIGSGASMLRLEQVEADLGWSSLFTGNPYFRRLAIIGPELSVVREPDGHVHMAGIELGGGTGEDGLAAWLFSHGEIAVLDARISWDDRQRGAPLLSLDDFGLRVERTAGRYRFGLQGRPDASLASRIDVRGDLVSDQPANAQRWEGQVYARLTDGQLAGLKPWVDYPLPLSGAGDVEAWLSIAGGALRSASIDFALADFAMKLSDDVPEITAHSARGRLTGTRTAAEQTLKLSGFELLTGDGVRIGPTDIDLRLATSGGGALQTSSADLGVVVQLSAHLPMSQALRQDIAAHDPRGQVEDLRLEWSTESGVPTLTRLEARFFDLALRSTASLPGGEGLSGEVRGDGSTGRFVLASRDAVLDIPQVFSESRLAFDRVDAEGGWSLGPQGLEVRVDRGAFENTDVTGQVSGVYRPAVGEHGEVDIAARLTRAEGPSVWRYVPDYVGTHTRDWLQNSIREAHVDDARLSLRGGLADFPFEDGSGEFVVTVDLRDGLLEYAPGWPMIEGIAASLRFEGPGARISASAGSILGVQLHDVVAELPDLDMRRRQPMTIRGVARGATADFLRFVSASPVRDSVNGFTDGMSAEGNGELQLALTMPLHDLDETKVEGDFRFAGNRIGVIDWLPPVDNASGRVRFSESTFGVEGARGQAFGQPLRISAQTVAPGQVRFKVDGGLSSRTLGALYGLPALSHLSGTTRWNADVAVGKGTTRVEVRSDLAGISSSLPHPLNKSAAEAWPLRVEVGFAGEARDFVGRIGDRLAFSVSGEGPAEQFRVSRGGIAVRAPLKIPQQGLSLAMTLDEFDVDAWRALQDDAAGHEGLPWAEIDVRVARLRAFGYELADFELATSASDGAWGGRIASDLVRGGFAWHGGAQGTLALRLDHLRLGRREASESELVKLLREEAAQTSLPDMDVIVDHFRLGDVDLGRLDLQARNENGEWLIDSASIESADAQVTARGRWLPGGTPTTQLALRLESPDLGSFLGRMGYPDMVRKGSALLSGELEWRGVPTRIDYPSLNGAFRVDARNGRFSQLEPGVGRLLGVLSLQALPRRLVLDFRDVFSEGFAFDRIGGNVQLRSGILDSEDFEIAGPAARVWIAGTADVMKETQDLKVVVQPALTDSVAIGAAAGMVNPVAGLVAYLAQKIMNDPVERMFAYGYAITGRWDDPQVEELPVGKGRRKQGEGGTE